MKFLLFIIFLLFLSSNIIGQELNLGGLIGTKIKRTYDKNLEFGVLLEFKPIKSILSINNEYYIDNIGSGYIDGATSFFFKLDFGRKIKIGPIFGVFLRTNFISGFNSGLNFQYEFTKNILFVKGDMMTEILGPYNNPQGSGYAFTDKTRRFWIRFGIKRKLLRNK